MVAEVIRGDSPKSDVVAPTAAEFRVLEELWQLGHGTVEDLLAQISIDVRPHYKTIQALLRLLEEKGFIEHRLHGKAFVYQPIYSRPQVQRLCIDRFVRQYFHCSRPKLMTSLLEDEHLSETELERLEAMVRRHKR